jgi:hypothetical protein
MSVGYRDSITPKLHKTKNGSQKGCRKSLNNVLTKGGMDSLRSPCGRTSCVCRRVAPRLNHRHADFNPLLNAPLWGHIQTLFVLAWNTVILLHLHVRSPIHQPTSQYRLTKAGGIGDG